MTTAPRVYLIGAGPGAADLVTLRATHVLGLADVILYDYLVNPELLVHARPSAERCCLGGHGQSQRWTQDAVNDRMVAEALRGKIVARLKSGDPMIFGRVAEEISALQQHGIDFEIVPGVSAAVAAASAMQIPVTHRDRASAVAWVAGHEANGKSSSDLDYAALARFPGTLVFYMGVVTANDWTRRLMEAGKSPETPVCLVRRCTWPDEESLACRLDEVAAKVTPRAKFPPPVIAIVGSVVADATRPLSRVVTSRLGSATESVATSERSLQGLRVFITRPAHQAEEWAEPLRRLGAEVHCAPAIEVLDPPSWDEVDEVLENLESFSWIVFCSRNGVQKFFARARERHIDPRRWERVACVAVGPATATALADHGAQVVEMPDRDYSAEGIVDLLRDRVSGRRVLILRANRGRDVMTRPLQAAGGILHQITAYTTRDVVSPDKQTRALLRDGRMSWVTVASSATARAIHQWLEGDARNLGWISLSHITSDTLRELGMTPIEEASEATTDGLIDAVVRAKQHACDERGT